MTQMTKRNKSAADQGWRRAGAALALAAGLAAPTLAQATTVPPGGADAGTMGVFGTPIPWTIIPIHTMLLPTGQVLSFGANEKGQQGGQFNYDVWNPALGTELLAHTLLPNATGVDLFCAFQTIIPSTGKVLLAGGDLTVNGARNNGNSNTEIFDPNTSTLVSDNPMQFPRWYPSVVTLPNGKMVAIGGRGDKTALDGDGAPTPEIYTVGTGWQQLTGATNETLFNKFWYYPRSYLAPNGKIFMLLTPGTMFYLDPTGNGSLKQLPGTGLPGSFYSATLMYEPGKVLSLRKNQKVVVVDVNSEKPVVTETANMDQERAWANATVLANGKVVVSGGSAQQNELVGIAYSTQIWDPATGQWTLGASATKPRLYHSIALLLPDGTVLTGGGGAPGPIKQLNGEIYYPPYLYKKDGSGQPAPRPVFTTTWDATTLGGLPWITSRADSAGYTHPITRVTMLRLGSVTHTYNSDSRFIEVPFTANPGNRNLMLRIPTDANRVVPGYYMLFAFNSDGVPSIAKIIRVTAT